MEKQPIAVVNAAAAVVVAIIYGLAHAFGWSDDAVTLITGISAAVAALVATLVGRANVYSPATHRQEVAAAARRSNH